MKHLKSCTAAVLALLAADAAFAQTTIRLTGSTAFRSSAITSITNLLGTNYDVAYSGSTPASAQFSTFVGTIGANPVIIQCSWTGSVDGIRDVAQAKTQPFIKATSVPNLNSSAIEQTVVSSDILTAVYENSIPDIAFADNGQTSTTYRMATGTIGLKELDIAIIPFVFVKGNLNSEHPSYTSFRNVTNITSNMARKLYYPDSRGLKLSIMNGADDKTTIVYGLGRDFNSGTRLQTFSEIGIGSAGLSNVYQPQPVNITNDSTQTISGLASYPTTTGFTQGNQGYSSGGLLSKDLARIVAPTATITVGRTTTPFALIGYMGTSDAASALAAGNVLSYNGVSLVKYIGTTPAWDDSVILKGQYSLWGKVRLSYRDGVVDKATPPNNATTITQANNPVAKGFIDSMVVNLKASVVSPIVSVDNPSLKATRDSDTLSIWSK